MSSLPPSNGPKAQSSANGIPKVIRRRVNADPLFRPKKPTSLPPAPLLRPGAAIANGHLALANQLSRPSTPSSQRSPSPAKAAPAPYHERVSGFSDPRVTAQGIPFKDYKLVVTKRDLLDGIRFHLAQLPEDKPRDIRSESDFIKPVRLHRRDPRAAVAGTSKEEAEDVKDGLNQAQREDLNARKEERQREREENLKQIAPSASSKKQTSSFKKKSQQVYRPEYTSEQKIRIQTNFEEKLPWHLEDFDNKHCFVGKNQIGSSRVHAALVNEISADGTTNRFRMLPVEKIYHFGQKRDIIPTMTIEEAETAMKKSGFIPERLVRQREAREAEAKLEREARKGKGLFSGGQAETIAGRTGEEADLDFDDDFADDEEGDLFVDKDEDEKIAEKKIKEDQLTANFFDHKDEKEFDAADLKEKKEAEARKKNFRDLRKALEKRERNYNHGSDSDSFGDSSDSEEERERIEKERLANLAKEEVEANKSNLPSSGTNTPSSRKEKHGGLLSDRESGIMKKSSSSKSLKRPGSPNLSDASGTDASTTRKKKLKSRHLSTSSTQPTPQPSRPISPANANIPSSSAPAILKKKRKSGAPGSAAGSDTETAAYSDAAMSDGSSGVGRTKRLKLNMGSRSPGTLTPQPESRAISPAPGADVKIRGGSGNGNVLPTTEEIRARIPEEGISTRALLHSFGSTLPKDRHGEFIKLVKQVARLDHEKKLMFLK